MERGKDFALGCYCELKWQTQSTRSARCLWVFVAASISPNLMLLFILRFEGGFQNRWNTSPPLAERTTIGAKSLCLPLDISSPLVRAFFLPELAGFIWVAVFIWLCLLFSIPTDGNLSPIMIFTIFFHFSWNRHATWWSREDMTELHLRWPMLPILFLPSRAKTFRIFNQ